MFATRRPFSAPCAAVKPASSVLTLKRQTQRYDRSALKTHASSKDHDALLGAAVVMTGLMEQPVWATAAEAPALQGVSVLQGALLIAPVLLYSVFSVYRTTFNRNAKISDFLFLVASVVIFGNIVSALVLKVRLFNEINEFNESH